MRSWICVGVNLPRPLITVGMNVESPCTLTASVGAKMLTPILTYDSLRLVRARPRPTIDARVSDDAEDTVWSEGVPAGLPDAITFGVLSDVDLFVGHPGEGDAAFLLIEHSGLLRPSGQEDEGDEADDGSEDTFPEENLPPPDDRAEVRRVEETGGEETTKSTRKRRRQGEEETDAEDEFLAAVVPREEESNAWEKTAFGSLGFSTHK